MHLPHLKKKPVIAHGESFRLVEVGIEVGGVGIEAVELLSTLTWVE